MTDFLSCVFQTRTPERANDIATLLRRRTRPIFEQDVPEPLKREFEIIDRLEYPDAVDSEGSCVVSSWFEKDRLDFLDLSPLWDLENLTLIIAEERDTYAGSEDSGDLGHRYWIGVDGEPRPIRARPGAESLAGTEVFRRGLRRLAGGRVAELFWRAGEATCRAVAGGS